MTGKGLLDDSGPEPPSDVTTTTPTADSSCSRMKSGEAQTNPQSSWVAVVQNSGEPSVGPVALVSLDVLAAIDKSQHEDLGLADEHLKSCHPYATYEKSRVSNRDVLGNPMYASTLIEVTVVLQPDDEDEKSTVSNRDVLGNPMYASTLIEVVHEIRSSSTEISINGAAKGFQWMGYGWVWELDQTFPQKPNDEVSIEPVVPTMVEEDQEDLPNSIPVALRMVLGANATQAYLASLTSEGQ
ncbi:hypothetical protein Nepgr_006625 [Nepenthes gracilis]|uniref:Uncharacterized protein n=1 Tax=Nepenthes gracilis TaxID=150966 RepID=A0AAD3XHL9_NEPGR|nr:hypothetical protein Nepgr_006625 [Nepenthes gracilis]